jgi:hypothetical protein
MTRTLRLLLAFTGVLLFAVGLLLGQIQRSKFDKYLRPTTVTSMQLAVLEANIEVIRNLLPSETGTGIPTVYFDPSCPCLLGTSLISSDLMKKPLDEVRHRLLNAAIMTRTYSSFDLPEISEWKSDVPDPYFKMRFRQFKGNSVVVVAEYVDGKIVFK